MNEFPLHQLANIDVQYEDNHVIVAVKPPNMLSQADKTGDTDILSQLKEYIKIKYNKPGASSIRMYILYFLPYPPNKFAPDA